MAELLEASCPDVSVKFIIKHQNEWKSHLDSVIRCYGFTSRESCPLVYTIEGTCIGNASDFIEHVLEKYGVKATNLS